MKDKGPAYLYRLFCGLGLAVLVSSSAHAACTSPDGERGEQVFNSTYKVMQFCDGTAWVRMDGFGSGKWIQGTGYLYREQGGVAVGTSTMDSTTAGTQELLRVGGKAKTDTVELTKRELLSTAYVTDLSRLPVVDNAQRNNIATPTLGMVVFNSTEGRVEFYNGTTWMAVSVGIPVPPNLYNFTSHTFTNCGQAGRTGPSLSQCRSSYNPTDGSWDDDPSFFNMSTNGIQEWIVPQDGTYRITANGARGGYNHSYYYGARMRGDFALTQGDKLYILVGQMGTGSNYHTGGGGTFVATGTALSSSTPVIVAGGGAGADNRYWSSGNPSRGQGTTGTSGQQSGYCQSTTYAAGTNGSGGQDGGGNAGGGGGFYGNAQAAGSVGGYAFVNGGIGGFNSTYGDGGFGGGGSTSDDQGSAGGGYSGGGGCAEDGHGGGGGSFNGGTNQSNSAGANNTHGSVQIERLP